MARPFKYTEEERALHLRKITELEQKVFELNRKEADHAKEQQQWRRGYRDAFTDVMETVYPQ